MTAKPITIAGVRYPTLKLAKSQLRKIRISGNLDDKITNKADVEMLMELFHALPFHKALLENRRIIGWGREWGGTICFAALLDDGSRLKFDTARCLRAVRALQLND